MRASEELVFGYVAAGVGLIAVWVVALVAAGRRGAGGTLFQPAGWGPLVAAGACGVLGGAALLAVVLVPGAFEGGGLRGRVERLEAIGLLLTAAAQGLALLALLSAWRACDAAADPAAAAPPDPTDEPNPLDAPFPAGPDGGRHG